MARKQFPTPIRFSNFAEKQKEKRRSFDRRLCWRYLSFRAVASQVLSTEMSLTTVFGMGTGGPSS